MKTRQMMQLKIRMKMVTNQLKLMLKWLMKDLSITFIIPLLVMMSPMTLLRILPMNNKMMKMT